VIVLITDGNNGNGQGVMQDVNKHRRLTPSSAKKSNHYRADRCWGPAPNHTQAQKADGADAGAQGGVSPTPVATDRAGDKPD
jgi:hypothetical protein